MLKTCCVSSVRHSAFFCISRSLSLLLPRPPLAARSPLRFTFRSRALRSAMTNFWSNHHSLSLIHRLFRLFYLSLSALFAFFYNFIPFSVCVLAFSRRAIKIRNLELCSLTSSQRSANISSVDSHAGEGGREWVLSPRSFGSDSRSHEERIGR